MLLFYLHLIYLVKIVWEWYLIKTEIICWQKYWLWCILVIYNKMLFLKVNRFYLISVSLFLVSILNVPSKSKVPLRKILHCRYSPFKAHRTRTQNVLLNAANYSKWNISDKESYLDHTKIPSRLGCRSEESARLLGVGWTTCALLLLLRGRRRAEAQPRRDTPWSIVTQERCLSLRTIEYLY